MIINISNLKEGINNLCGKDKAEIIRLDKNIFPEYVSTEVTIEKRGLNYYLDFISTVFGEFQCDRCLEKFTKEIIAKSQIIYTEDFGLIDGENEPEIIYLKPGEEEICISENIRQFILLNVPIKLLCSENCKGLCPNCGENLNISKCNCKEELIDPRWEKLKKLKI
jgi:uncharacterized protein